MSKNEQPAVPTSPESIRRSNKDFSNWQWRLDNASNVHVASDLRYYIVYEGFVQNTQVQSVRGFQNQFTTKPIGQGTVQIQVQNGSSINVITLFDVLYVSDSMKLISHTQAEDQCITVTYCKRNGNKSYEHWKNNHKTFEINKDECGLSTFDAMTISISGKC